MAFLTAACRPFGPVKTLRRTIFFPDPPPDGVDVRAGTGAVRVGVNQAEGAADW